MPTQRVVIDPITRIEGHLRIELETANGRIVKAWTPCTQIRGIELVLKDRDPRDAWAIAQRICGVCTTMHALASICAVEDALGIAVPSQAKFIRDIMSMVQMVHDHMIHFYQLQALDWVNVPDVLKADPVKAEALASSMSEWPLNSRAAFANAKEKVQSLVNRGQMSIFTNGYWDHPDYRLTPELNLIAVAHYMQCLEVQREIVKIHTIFGGKNPHPNFLVGGMACSISMDSEWTINQIRLDVIHSLVEKMVTFTEQVMLPDVLAIGQAYKDYASIGEANPNLMMSGLPGRAIAGDPSATQEPCGVLMDGDYQNVKPFEHSKIAEYVNSAWYTYTTGNGTALPPFEGQTTLDYTGPAPPYDWLSDDPKNSWTKIPRYENRAMQVGPNARMMIACALKLPQFMTLVSSSLEKLEAPQTALNSTLGRVLARVLESVYCARECRNLFQAFAEHIKAGETTTFNPAKWQPATWPGSARGFSFVEAPRGTLGHWVKIDDGRISHYQAIVPTTWNASGADPMGVPGPFAYSLSAGGNHPLVDPRAPLEVLRTIHSYDPCMSCAVHVMDATGRPITEVRVL